MSAALAAAVLLLAALAGSAAAFESHGALRDAFVAPRVGTPATVVRFSVTLQIDAQRSAAHVHVLIDGVASDMSPVPGGASGGGVRYRFSTSLPIGTHDVRFGTTDGPADSVLAAGVVTIRADDGGDPGAGSGGGTPSPSGGTDGDTKTGGGGTPKPSAPPAPTASPTPGDPTNPPAPDPTPTPASTGAPHHGAGSSPGSSTGGAQATRPDASGAADHPTSGSGGGPASGGSSAGAPPAAGAGDGSAGASLGPSATSPLDGLALGLIGAPGDGSDGPAGPGGTVDSGGTGGTGGSGGAGGPERSLDDGTLAVLTGDGPTITPAERMLIAAISTTATTTVLAAFFMFGKRRRDGEPPAPDDVLAADAGRLTATPASALVPNATNHPGSGARLTDETGIPRWRRPSLIEARKTDPRYSATAAHDRQAFNHGGDPGTAGTERRKIRYRAVSLLDAPDPLRSAEIGDLDEGDEVQLLEKSGGYWLVLCPDGTQGWVHRMTLGDVVEYDGGSSAFNAARRSFAPRVAQTEGPALAGQSAEFREADRSIAEDGTDLLSAYLKSRRT